MGTFETDFTALLVLGICQATIMVVVIEKRFMIIRSVSRISAYKTFLQNNFLLASLHLVLATDFKNLSKIPLVKLGKRMKTPILGFFGEFLTFFSRFLF